MIQNYSYNNVDPEDKILTFQTFWAALWSNGLGEIIIIHWQVQPLASYHLYLELTELLVNSELLQNINIS